MPLFLLLLCSIVFAQVQGETPALTPLASEKGTYLVAMPTYTYSRVPGTLGLNAEEETWVPDKWKNRRIFNRFIPMIDWEKKQSGIWFYTGNEIGDELWQELAEANGEPNKTPMLYGGFATPPFGGFYATAEFNQIDHFSEANFNARRKRANSQEFSWFGENLPAYSGVWGGAGYNGTGGFFKNTNVLVGSEYLWAWNQEEWVPIRINPRVEGNASFYFMETEIELFASTEKFQIKDSAAENRSNFGLRLKGENTGGGLYTSRIGDEENIVTWVDFNHTFFEDFTNGGFIALSSQQRKHLGFTDVELLGFDIAKPFSFTFADSLEYKINLSNPTDLILGVLLNPNGIKIYGETTYDSKPFQAKTRAYQNYSINWESIGFDGEISYRSRLAWIGAAYSREFFEYYRDSAFYDIKPAESSAKLFLKYRFLKDLLLTHEWIYRDLPTRWLWNFQAEQKIPKLNTSLYAVWLHVLSKNRRDFPFGGEDRARFYCGINTGF
ncbi:MAG: hypothetical protein FWF67_02645 [Fibromonadales bacterium]|nr:hypothetical protein [Fibromonadales bacterium]